MQSSDEGRLVSSRGGNQSRESPAPIETGRKKRSLGASCLIWAVLASVCLMLVGVVVIGAVYAGWNSGVVTARANATIWAEATVQQECALITQNLLEGKLSLAERRLAALELEDPAPDCVRVYAPTATALHLLSQPSPTPSPTMTATYSVPTVQSTPAQTSAEVADESVFDYDLDALLAEAQVDFDRRDFPNAIDTLSAIISIDADFQRDFVRRLYLEALKAQAEFLYRSSKLSEAIILTDRARAYGDVGSLSYEYFIADAYLNAQRYKTTNPAEAVRLLRRIVNEQGLLNYMNGRVISELQDALRYYADALALQGDACQAQDQYLAALELNPSIILVNRAELASKGQQAELACNALRQTAQVSGATTPGAPPAAIGIRSQAGPAPEGQSG